MTPGLVARPLDGIEDGMWMESNSSSSGSSGSARSHGRATHATGKRSLAKVMASEGVGAHLPRHHHVTTTTVSSRGRVGRGCLWLSMGAVYESVLGRLKWVGRTHRGWTRGV